MRQKSQPIYDKAISFIIAEFIQALLTKRNYKYVENKA